MTGMKSLWGRKVSDLGFGDFLTKLQYIAAKKGKTIRFIDQWYPLSKTYSACGVINDNLELRDRHWQCPSCHTQLDRDRNAAINIHRVGGIYPFRRSCKPWFAGLTSLIEQFQL